MVEVNCIFHFTYLRTERSNCFDIINSFCSTRLLNILKITITSSFAKLPHNIFHACLNLMCQQKDLNHPVAVVVVVIVVVVVVITVDTENATINA